MKKHTYLIFTVLELLSLGGAWAVRYFTRRKLGMMRFVNHESRALDAALPMDSIRIGCIVLLAVILLVAAVLLGLRRRQLSRSALPIVLASAILSAAVLGFVLKNTIATLSYYYFAVPLLLLAALLQFCKAVLSLRTQK